MPSSVGQRPQLGDVLDVPARARRRRAADHRARPWRPRRRAAARRSSCRATTRRRRARTAWRRRGGSLTWSPGLVAVAGPEQLVVDRLGDEAQLGRVDVQVVHDLPPQALRVDDDRVRDLGRARVAHPPVQRARRAGWPAASVYACRVLKCTTKDGAGPDDRRHQRAQDVDLRQRKAHRRVEVLGQGALRRALVRPGEGDVVDVRPVALVHRTRLRADQQVEFLVRRSGGWPSPGSPGSRTSGRRTGWRDRRSGG